MTMRLPPLVRRSDEIVSRRGQSLSQGMSDMRRSVSWLTGHRLKYTFPGGSHVDRPSGCVYR